MIRLGESREGSNLIQNLFAMMRDLVGQCSGGAQLMRRRVFTGNDGGEE